jgi:hypothetical protein
VKNVKHIEKVLLGLNHYQLKKTMKKVSRVLRGRRTKQRTTAIHWGVNVCQGVGGILRIKKIQP